MLRLLLTAFLVLQSCQANDVSELHPEASYNVDTIEPEPRGLLDFFLNQILKKVSSAIDCFQAELDILNNFKLPIPLAIGDPLLVKNLYLINGVNFENELSGKEVKGKSGQVKIDFSLNWKDLQLGTDYKINLQQFTGDGNVGLHLNDFGIIANATVKISLFPKSFKLLDLKAHLDLGKLQIPKFVNNGIDLSKDFNEYLDVHGDDLLYMTNYIIEDIASLLIKRLSGNQEHKENAINEIEPIVNILSGQSSRMLDLKRCIKMLS